MDTLQNIADQAGLMRDDIYDRIGFHWFPFLQEVMRLLSIFPCRQST